MSAPRSVILGAMALSPSSSAKRDSESATPSATSDSVSANTSLTW